MLSKSGGSREKSIGGETNRAGIQRLGSGCHFKQNLKKGITLALEKIKRGGLTTLRMRGRVEVALVGDRRYLITLG